MTYDGSATYMGKPQVFTRLETYSPDTKIIFFMREPIRRLVSEVQHWYAKNLKLKNRNLKLRKGGFPFYCLRGSDLTDCLPSRKEQYYPSLKRFWHGTLNKGNIYYLFKEKLNNKLPSTLQSFLELRQEDIELFNNSFAGSAPNEWIIRKDFLREHVRFYQNETAKIEKLLGFPILSWHDTWDNFLKCNTDTYRISS